MKTDIKILRIMYVIIFIVGFLLFFHYTNEKEVNIENPDYTYEIRNIEEERTGIIYTVDIDEPYSYDTLVAISEEIRSDYNHIYNLEKTEDKVKYFEIMFYYDYEIFYILSNDFTDDETSNTKTKDISEEIKNNEE